MIKTQEEYTNACNFIDSDLGLYDFQLSEKMTSYEYNLYLQDTEYFLNFLYEKIRILEELCDYLDDYSDTKIHKAKEKISQMTALLEHSMDSYLDNDVYTTVPDWNRSISSDLIDRDGKQVPIAEFDLNIVSAAAQYTNKAKPLQYETKDMALYSCEQNAAKGRYLISTQSNNGGEATDRQQTIVHAFVSPSVTWNHVMATPVNCKLSFEKTQDGVTITMTSNGYDKEFRPFDYEPYAGSALNQLPKTEPGYQTNRTIAGNRRVLYDAREEGINQDYMRNVEQRQIIQDKNQSKARIREQS